MTAAARVLHSDEFAMTLEACAQKLFDDGDTERVLSREMVRLIQNKALGKLRVALAARGLRMDDLIGDEFDSPTCRVEHASVDALDSHPRKSTRSRRVILKDRARWGAGL